MRRGGWFLIAVGTVGLAVWVVTRALGATTDDEFDRWVGWANVLALLLTGIGTALVIIDRVNLRPPSTPASTEEATDHSRPEPPVFQVQHVEASGGTAQGVMNGTIINHHGLTASEPPGDAPADRRNRTVEHPDVYPGDP